MEEIKRSILIEAPIDRVWQTVRSFDRWDRWLSRVEDCQMEDGEPADRIGCVRVMGTPSGKLRERLTGLSEVRHAIEYSMLEAPGFSLDSHHAAVVLTAVSEPTATVVEWSASLEAENEAEIARVMADEVFPRGLADLAAHLGSTPES